MTPTSIPIRGFVFDLGKTLAVIPKATDEEECLAQLLDVSDVDHIRTVIYRICDRFPGQSIEEFLTRMDHVLNPTGKVELSRRMREVWDESIKTAVLTDGATEVLALLRQSGMKLALVSNTPPTTHRIIERLGLVSAFDEIVFSCDVGFLKPDPRIFRVALERLGLDAAETVVVGDKVRTDILGGAILGMEAILVEPRMRGPLEDSRGYVKAIVRGVSEIPHTEFWRRVVKSTREKL